MIKEIAKRFIIGLLIIIVCMLINWLYVQHQIDLTCMVD